MTTRIEVVGDPARPWCRLRGGLLVARQLPSVEGVLRVALVASTALLLSGDQVRVEVAVADGLALEVVETAGTVAYAMRGGAASWDVTVSLGRSATVTWSGLPFVVADGADVRRSTEIDLAGGAVAVLRESLVLGGPARRAAGWPPAPGPGSEAVRCWSSPWCSTPPRAATLRCSAAHAAWTA